MLGLFPKHLSIDYLNTNSLLNMQATYQSNKLSKI